VCVCVCVFVLVFGGVVIMKKGELGNGG
jgi:hypothetical protein